jgi:hypothetical protein
MNGCQCGSLWPTGSTFSTIAPKEPFVRRLMPGYALLLAALAFSL